MNPENDDVIIIGYGGVPKIPASTQHECSVCGEKVWVSPGSMDTVLDAANETGGKVRVVCMAHAPDYQSNEFLLGPMQAEEIKKHGVGRCNLMVDDDAQPGDPAPGGGIVGGVGIDAERFLKAIIGRNNIGAWPCGTKVRKANGEPQDRTPDGATGTVMGSIGDGRVIAGAHMGYMVKWDEDPTPVFTTNKKLELAATAEVTIMQDKSKNKTTESTFGVFTEGTWSERMQGYRDMLEDIGKDLSWDEDWPPMVVIETDTMPATIPGEKIPAEQVGKPGRIVFALKNAFNTEEDKDRIADLLGLSCIKTRARSMALMQVVWMLELKALHDLKPIEGESKEQFSERLQAEALRLRGDGMIKDHPDRRERLWIYSAANFGRDDDEQGAFATIVRTEGSPPKLTGWTIANADASNGFMGRFPESIKLGIELSAKLIAAEAAEAAAKTKGGK